MTDKNKEALEALDNWIQDADRFIVPFGELTKAEYNLCNHAETIRNALQAQEWQPIETAPRDGSRIMLSKWVGHFDHKTSCWWIIDGFYKAEIDDWYRNTDGRLNEPTHWKPIDAPKVKE